LSDAIFVSGLVFGLVSWLWISYHVGDFVFWFQRDLLSFKIYILNFSYFFVLINLFFSELFWCLDEIDLRMRDKKISTFDVFVTIVFGEKGL
jgi:hypothetical protein